MSWLRRHCNHLRTVRKRSANGVVVRDVCVLCRAELERQFVVPFTITSKAARP